MLDAGANPSIVDNLGMTPLHYAAKLGLEDIVNLLVSHGVDINLRDKNGFNAACPKKPENVGETFDWLTGYSSGYIQRSLHLHPKQGDKKPWVNYQDYIRDWIDVKFSKLEDGNLVFSKN